MSPETPPPSPPPPERPEGDAGAGAGDPDPEMQWLIQALANPAMAHDSEQMEAVGLRDLARVLAEAGRDEETEPVLAEYRALLGRLRLPDLPRSY